MKTKYPLISVIIPSRPFEKFESVKSVKKQTYPNIEIITFVDKDLKGAVFARNEGRKKAKGEYLFWCDNDIELEPNCLMDLYNCLQENKSAGWAFGKFIIDSTLFNVNKGPEPLNKYTKDLIDYFYCISTMSLIRASANPVWENWHKEYKRYDDWSLWIRLCRAGHSSVFCDKLLFRTVNRPHGISMQGERSSALKAFYEKYMERIADIVIPHHNRHDLLQKCLEGINNLNFYIHIESGGTFAENCNRGAKKALTDTIIFLNDDVITNNEALIQLSQTKEKICGITQTIGGMKIYGMGFKRENHPLIAKSFVLATKEEELFFPSGFCFKISKKVFKDLGGFDERFKNGAEDCDLFFKAWEKNINIGWIDYPMPHLHSQSEGRFASDKENCELFEEIWKERIKKIKFKKLKKNLLTTNDILKRVAKNDFYYNNKLVKKNDCVIIKPEDIETLKRIGCVD